MTIATWLVSHKDLIEVFGVVGALLFNGIQLHIDARVRRGESVLEITKQHRDLWNLFCENPRLSHLFDKERELTAHPLTDEEVRFANFLFLHIRASYYAEKARIFRTPERLGQDIRETLTMPGPRAAWERMKSLHEREFVTFIERTLS